MLNREGDLFSLLSSPEKGGLIREGGLVPPLK